MSTSKGSPSRLSLQVEDALLLRVYHRGALPPVVAVDEIELGVELREGHASGGASVDAVRRKDGLCRSLQLGVLLNLLRHLAVCCIMLFTYWRSASIRMAGDR